MLQVRSKRFLFYNNSFYRSKKYVISLNGESDVTISIRPKKKKSFPTVLQRCLGQNKSEKRFYKNVGGKTKVKNGFTKMSEAKQKWKTVLQKCRRQNKSEKQFYKNVGGKTKVKNGFTKMSEAKQKWKTVLLNNWCYADGLIYRVSENIIEIVSCKGHYQD